MRIDPVDGDKEVIEKALNEYGLVIGVIGDDTNVKGGIS
ncbi:Uncharacterized protein dnl_06060 [Desulfonema limicola]|uniref:Uncharacterized protein n=1 Tax=Desulfonema limicola TaxID=45656 RepID=A0A975B435_9BACT|nr:Uncharacterized protein dnl_06060 [Desulfonema limicola]